MKQVYTNIRHYSFVPSMEKNVPEKSNVTTEHLVASQNVSYIVSNKDDIDGVLSNEIHCIDHHTTQ